MRVGVEGTLSQGVRAFGMRRSRNVGLVEIGLQQACTGATMNVSRAVSGCLRGRLRSQGVPTSLLGSASADSEDRLWGWRSGAF